MLKPAESLYNKECIMVRMRLSVVCKSIFLAFSGGCVSPVPSATQPTTAPKQIKFSDAAVKSAIEKGARFLWSKQQTDGGWPAYGKPRAGLYYRTGPGAMAIYALLKSGVNPQEPRIVKALQWLKKTPETMTYSLGM
jgi:hypothetical protein